jgi:hypothetical protein
MPAKYDNESMLPDLRNRFTYHPPKEGQADRYQEIRTQIGVTAEFIALRCPQSRELSLALTHLQEASMWANAAIACNE